MGGTGQASLRSSDFTLFRGGMADFTCNFLQPGKPFVHFGEHTVGSGHAPLALRADWQAPLLLCHNELGFQHVRFHALLSEPMETLICEENTRESTRIMRTRGGCAGHGRAKLLERGASGKIEGASCLVKESQPWTHEKNAIHLPLALPSHAVAAITIDFS